MITSLSVHYLLNINFNRFQGIAFERKTGNTNKHKMKKLEIVGYKRATLGTKGSKDLRAEALAPCVLYGGKEQLHFAVPMEGGNRQHLLGI